LCLRRSSSVDDLAHIDDHDYQRCYALVARERQVAAVIDSSLKAVSGSANDSKFNIPYHVYISRLPIFHRVKVVLRSRRKVSGVRCLRPT